MNAVELTQIISYPVKSTAGWAHQSTSLQVRGFGYDRQWAIANTDYRIFTGREKPQLMDIFAEVHEQNLQLRHRNGDELIIPVADLDLDEIEAQMFRKPLPGMAVKHQVNEWLSDHLGFKAQLLYMAPQLQHHVKAKYGGTLADKVNFVDLAPINLLSEASLADLNQRLEVPVAMERFRPNLVIRGVEAYGEDQWKKIQIGDCEFDLISPCRRCVFTTIDPVTKVKHPEQEPLRTLTSYRQLESGGIAFGMYLIPRKMGQLELGMELKVLA